MKTSILGLFSIMAFLFGASAFAAPTVDVTSFVYVDAKTNLAELCGTSAGVTVPVVVHAAVDVTAKNPANYNTVVDGNGRFCLVVLTLQGSATLSIGSATTRAVQAIRP